MDDEAGGILNIALSDSDADDTPAKPGRRTDQTESAFQEVKASYSVRVENGNISKSLNLPLPSSADKTQVQDAIYAVEELYFFKRFDEAKELVDRLLSEGDFEKLVSGQDKELLELYRSRSEAKLKKLAA